MVGFDEVLFIAIVALLLFGPDKLPEYIRELGRLYAEFKRAQRDLELEFRRGASPPPPAPKPPSGTVLEIARRMNIPQDGKTEERLLKEIEQAVSAETRKL